MTSDTLDGMTVEQLREIAKRATATASAKEAEQAEAKKRVQEAEKAAKDAKDIIPDADGTIWEYSGRLWTVVLVDRARERLLYSVPVNGGAMRGWWCSDRFSTSYIPKYGGWMAKTLVEGRATDTAIVRLALRVRD